MRRILLIGGLLMMGGVALGVPAPTPKPPTTAPATAPTPTNVLTVTGKLTTGIMAMGGETTGTVIDDGKTSYELDIKDAALMKKADGLNGKQVTVKGTLTIKQGIEVGQRRIIAVSSLDAAP